MLNDKALPFYEQHELPVLRILTDRGTEYCGRADRHDYQLFLAINDIGHAKTKVKSPQTNGICERFHKTILQEFYQVTFRKKIYETIEQQCRRLRAFRLRHREFPGGHTKRPTGRHARVSAGLEQHAHGVKSCRAFGCHMQRRPILRIDGRDHTATLEQERQRLRTSGRSRRYMERRIVPPGRVRLGPCHNRGGA